MDVKYKENQMIWWNWKHPDNYGTELCYSRLVSKKAPCPVKVKIINPETINAKGKPCVTVLLNFPFYSFNGEWYIPKSSIVNENKPFTMKQQVVINDDREMVYP